MLKLAGLQAPAGVYSGNCPSEIGRLQVAPAFEVLSASNLQVWVLSTHDEPTAHPCTALLKATSVTPMTGTLLGVGLGPGEKHGLPKTACGQLEGVTIGVVVTLGFSALVS